MNVHSHQLSWRHLHVKCLRWKGGEGPPSAHDGSLSVLRGFGAKPSPVSNSATGSGRGCHDPCV